MTMDNIISLIKPFLQFFVIRERNIRHKVIHEIDSIKPMIDLFRNKLMN